LPSTGPDPATPESSRLLDVVGLSYFPLALAARLPYAMIVVGVLTLVVAVRDSLTLGGLTSAAAGLGAAAIGPLIGAAADRWGQRPTLLVAATVNTLALVAMVIVVHSSLPSVAVTITAIVLGASAPQPGPMSRSRLVALIGHRIAPQHRPKVLQSTMAYESGADEMVFVAGPVLVGVLATVADPTAPVLAAAVLNLVAVGGFALHRTATEHSAHRTSTPPEPARQLFSAGVMVLVVAAFGVGTVFGSVLTSLTALMQSLGHADQSGLVYGVLGVGSAVLALASGRFPTRFRLASRLLVFAGVLVVGTVVHATAPILATTTGIPVLVGVVLAMAIAGTGVGPYLVATFSLAAERSPRGRSATVMTMVGSSLTVGQASSSALTGSIADAFSATTAMWLTVAAGGLVLLAALANRLMNRPTGTMVG